MRSGIWLNTFLMLLQEGGQTPEEIARQKEEEERKGRILEHAKEISGQVL